MLAGVAEYHTERHQVNRKRKRKTSDERKKQQTLADQMDDSEEAGQGIDESAELHISTSEYLSVKVPDPNVVSPLSPPQVLQHVTCGINEVTKKLESLARCNRQRLSSCPLSSDSSVPQEQTGSQLILVCRDDVNPPILINQLLEIVQ